MTMALTTVQGSLQEAVQVIDQSAREVDEAGAEPEKAPIFRSCCLTLIIATIITLIPLILNTPLETMV